MPLTRRRGGVAFQQKKEMNLMKRLLVLLLASLMLFAFVACDDNTPDPPAAEEPTPTPENPDKPNPDNPDPDVPEVCVHAKLIDTSITEYFDAEKHYPKSGICASCGEEVTRDAISISTADELMTLAKDMDKETAYDLGCYTISILADIDMTGENWPSPELNGYSAPHNNKDFVINGNGHTISNLIAGDNETTEAQGFIGSMWSDVTLEINDLTLENAQITANKGNGAGPGIGGFVGNIDSSPSVKISGCSLLHSNITGGHWAGGIYGYASGYDKVNDGPVHTSINISDCTVDTVAIKGDDTSVGGVMGHAGGNKDTTITVTDTTVTGCTITTENTTSAKAGAVLGTNGVGDVTLENVKYDGNTVSYGNTPNNDCAYGRLEFDGVGSLTIDGKPVTG